LRVDVQTLWLRVSVVFAPPGSRLAPIAGNGFATLQYGHVVANLDDAHNLFVKVMVETGTIGLIMIFILMQQMLSLGYRLIRRAFDAMHRGLGLCLILAIGSCAVANCFGDRWTYLVISGPLWILVVAGVRANQLRAEQNIRENALIAM